MPIMFTEMGEIRFGLVDKTIKVEVFQQRNKCTYGTITVGNTGLEIEACQIYKTHPVNWVASYIPEDMEEPVETLFERRKYTGMLAVSLSTLMVWWKDQTQNPEFHRHDLLDGNTNRVLFNLCRKLLGEHCTKKKPRYKGTNSLRINLQTLSQDQLRLKMLDKIATRALKQEYLIMEEI